MNALIVLIELVLLVTFSVSVQSEPLPASVKLALQKAHIPLSAVAIEVERSGKPLISLNANKAMNPASTMKLLTTYAGLELLGPAFRWHTDVYLDGKLVNGVLDGDLVFKGYGDPRLTVEEFWLWLHELRQRGLREIHGNIVLDKHFFTGEMPALIDNQPARAYNVKPDALLLSFNASALRLLPNGEKTIALMEPELYGYQVINQITTTSSLPCNGEDAYQSSLEGHTILLKGNIPADCGEARDFFALLPADEYFFAVFGALWREMGGQITGGVRDGAAPDQPPYSTHLSAPLSEIIRDIDKFSNNVMARQLFLTLGVLDDHDHASIAQNKVVMQGWLAKKQLKFPELVLENGAGLSRVERISAHSLVKLLQSAASSPYSAEFKAALPILGMDGTVKKRFKGERIAGFAHLKTGSLEDVKSIAGYVQGNSGKQCVMVFIVNHPNAKFAQPAQDALIEWVQKRH
jgi:D-alanyl-D-alanine carboxypeptidase/D-alanyl-D-alanine-endopeptidase (penicillin-binding protein 4)